MEVRVKLFATFRAGRFNDEVRQYPGGTTVREIARELQLSEDQLGIILVNSRHVGLDHELAGGDTLALFPLVGGG